MRGGSTSSPKTLPLAKSHSKPCQGPSGGRFWPPHRWTRPQRSRDTPGHPEQCPWAEAASGGDLALPKPCRNVDLGECCNQRALSPVFKPIMEPLPVGNQFVVISLRFGTLTLCRESEGRGSVKRRLCRSALGSIITEGGGRCGVPAATHATHASLTDKTETREAG